MITFNLSPILNFLSPILVPLVGLVLPAMVMASLSLHIQKNKIF
uniref:Photosystem I reaction center subunit VIII n=1 Tax=Haloragodendron glandulosum TaxID=434542 RepID=A0A8H2SH67_9MAGN|nr:photosystem I subunit VIII [Haloragodendron glandulosum]